MKSNRTLRVNLVSLLTGLFSFSIFILCFILFHYNPNQIFVETVVYKYSGGGQSNNLTIKGLIAVVTIILYLILNLILIVNSIFADEEDRVIDSKNSKGYFKVWSKDYFNWNVYLISLFPIVLFISITVNYLKQQYINYIDD